MKLIHKILASVALLCVALPAFVSCDKDDDNDEVAAVESIIGSYSGSLQATVTNIDCPMPGDYQIIIQKDKKEKDEVEIVLPQCSFENKQMGGLLTIPSLTVTGVDVKSSGNGYAISEDNYSVTVDGVVYSGSISGTVSNKSVDIFYTVAPGKMPMNISFTFKGSIK